MENPASIDIDAVCEQLLAMLQDDRNDDVVSVVRELLGKLSSENKRLAEQLAGMMRGRAHGGSERISEAQLALFLADLGKATDELEGEADAELEDDEDDDEDTADDTSADKPPPKKRKRVRVVGNVERVTKVSEPSPEDLVCPECGCVKSPAGHTCRVLVEVEPTRFRIIDFHRMKYACRTDDCMSPHMVIGPSAPTPLESGVLTASLLGDFLARKHADHEPVNRIAGSYERMGLEFPLGTLYGWVPVGADWLEPLADRIEELAIAAHILQVDDTGVDVLDADAEKGTRRGHLWAMLGDDTWAAFKFTPTWHATHTETFLGARQGWMQADGYPGYDRYYKRHDGAVEVGCWSHGRRYFVKTLDGGDKRAAKPLDIIRRIFKLERRATDKGWSDDRRLRMRKEKTVPLLNALGRWVDSVHAQAPPDTPLGRAITYLTNQWQALIQILTDGRLRLTNNAAERQLRHIALGRNAWLFTGSDAGGERLAVLYTIVATCKLASVDPRAYLIDVLDKLCRGWPASRLDELLPPQWAAAKKAAEQAEAQKVA